MRPALERLLGFSSEDRRVIMAKTAGLLYLGATAVSWSALHFLPQPAHLHLRVLDGISLLALATGILFLRLDWRKYPYQIFYFTTFFTLVYIGAFIYFSGGAASEYTVLYFLVIFWAAFFFNKRETLITAAVVSLFTLLPFFYDSGAASNQSTDELLSVFLFFLIGPTVNLLSRRTEEAYFREKKSAAEKSRSVAHLETLRQITKSMAAELESDRLLRLILAEGLKLLDFEVGGFLLWDPKQEAFALRAVANLPEELIGRSLKRGEGLAGRVAEEGRTVIVHDYLSLHNPLPGIAELPLKTHMGTPILWRGEVIGALNMATSKPNKVITPEDVRLAEMLAEHAAIALENTRLYAEAKTLHERFSLLVKEVAVSRNLDQIFEHLAEGLKRQIDYERLSVGFYDEAAREVKIIRIRTAGGETPVSSGYPPEDSAIFWVIQNQKPLIGADLAQSRRYREDAPLVQEGIRSYAIIPVMLRGEVIATLNIKSRRPGQFSEERVESLLPFADHLAPFIENARLFEELTRRKQEAEEASRLKTEFVSNVSHELRTPLNAIIGYTQLLLGELYGAVGGEQREPLERIRRNAGDLSGLVNNLLDLAKIEAGKMPVMVEPIDLERLLSEAFEGMRPLLEERPLEIVWQISPELRVIWSDPFKVRQIFLNLLSNAVKFTERGSIVISAQNAADGRGVLFSIRDTGVGMRREDIPRIFDRFRQIDGSTTRRVGGTGLGLAIVKETLHLIGGDIEVQSAPGKGSTFTVFLPDLRMASAGEKIQTKR